MAASANWSSLPDAAPDAHDFSRYIHLGGSFAAWQLPVEDVARDPASGDSPFVVGELALGNLRQRNVVLSALRDLPHAVSASNDEVLDFIEREALPGSGIGWVDAHLLASARLTSAHLWTRDKRLGAAADKLGLAAPSG